MTPKRSPVHSVFLFPFYFQRNVAAGHVVISHSILSCSSIAHMLLHRIQAPRSIVTRRTSFHLVLCTDESYSSPEMMPQHVLSVMICAPLSLLISKSVIHSLSLLVLPLARCSMHTPLSLGKLVVNVPRSIKPATLTSLKRSLLEIFDVIIIIDGTAFREVSFANPSLQGRSCIIINFDDRPANNGTNRFALNRAFQWWSYCILLKFLPRH